ncbi:unnamed protein product [Phytophthora lilii]|uniref:Unnamed protein product n=1 Tax=Phytophthora lilii TaxID=2077276 RepID=A0A9W6WN07_9STRA|nr:unnamed protein product [Phytophthora lilii]
MGGSSPLLTPHGVRQLFQDAADDAALRLQVLGVYRSGERGTEDEVEQWAVHSSCWGIDGGQVNKFKVLSEDQEDENQRLRVVLLQDVAVTSLSTDGVLPEKVVERRDGANRSDDQLRFLSNEHPRETGLLPLVGERVYYLPLRSNHYTLDWACSFTGGVADEDSPLDELQSDWAGQARDPDAVGTGGQNVTVGMATSSVVAWNISPEYCDNLFMPECKKLYTIMEVTEQIKKSNQTRSAGKPSTPMIGAIRVKSRVMNMGDPDFSNPFPFVFNAVVGKFLEMTKLTPEMLPINEDISQDRSSVNLQLRPSWLECSFVNTLSTLHWGKSAMKGIDIMYFDFVGVLSNVGKICRGRKRKLDEESPEVTEFRWVKMIDSSSSHELIVKISECSQPAVFRSLEAGNTLMITKLQWVVLPGSQTIDQRVQYATTSVFSVFRINEAIAPFRSIEECNLNVYFANNVKKNAVTVSRKVIGESKLGAHIEKKYHPRNRLPTNVVDFKETFGLKVCSFSDLSLLLVHMEAYEHRHVGFIGRVTAASVNDDSAKDEHSVLLELTESNDVPRTLTVAVSINPLFQRPVVKGSVKSATPPESLPLIRLLPTTVVDDLYANALTTSQSSNTPELSLAFIEEYLADSKSDFFFSLQLYRDGVGHVTWDVDAILAMP